MKKSILITDENREKIAAELAAVQKRCRARMITVDDIYYWADQAEEKLSRIAEYRRYGVAVVIDDNAQNFAQAYKGIPMSTGFMIKRTRRGWALKDLWRGQCLATRTRVYLTDKAKDGAIRYFQTI